MIYGMAHVGLYTDKFEETIEFYKNAFHAVELDRFTTDKRGCMLSIGDFCLEIFESSRLSDTGCFKHIALRCDNVDEAYAYALAQGAKPFIAPKDPGLKINKRIAFIKGINDEQIELCEVF